MALVEQRITDTGIRDYDKVQVAIERFRMFEPLALQLNPDDGYYICDSGGKDSSVIKKLAEMAGVKYAVHHNHTTLDHPETVYLVRREKQRYADMGVKFEIHYPELSFWRLMRKNKMPPLRRARYCCAELKEHGGENEFAVTGVRWAESPRRKADRGVAEVQGRSKSENLILNNDNETARKEVEHCQLKGKRLLNPIVDWEDTDVWEFIELYNLPMNPLYSMGYKRVGCVGCPMSTKQAAELDANPKYKAAFLRTFQRLIDDRRAVGETPLRETAQEYYDWWVSGKSSKADNYEQISFDEEI